MPRGRLGPVVVVALGLAVVGLSAGGPAAPAGRGPRLQTIAATTSHAAVVIDTGQEVKKFCLAFPEEEISGAEALRRVDAQVQFASFGSRGQAVCSLCGTGCPSSNCFCDPNRFWAYHRAGPGGAPYSFSRTGASATTVRNGDVEGWKWGGGEAPPAAKVSDVCNVDEPPVRSASAASSTTTTSSDSTTTAPPVASGRESADPPATADPVAPVTPTSSTGPGPRTPASAPANDAPSEASASTIAPVDPEPPVAQELAGEPVGAAPEAGSESSSESAAARAKPPPSDSTGSRVTLAVFGALLGGVLVWRARLRRAKVRPEGLVR